MIGASVQLGRAIIRSTSDSVGKLVQRANNGFRFFQAEGGEAPATADPPSTTEGKPSAAADQLADDVGSGLKVSLPWPETQTKSRPMRGCLGPNLPCA